MISSHTSWPVGNLCPPPPISCLQPHNVAVETLMEKEASALILTVIRLAHLWIVPHDNPQSEQNLFEPPKI